MIGRVLIVAALYMLFSLALGIAVGKALARRDEWDG